MKMPILVLLVFLVSGCVSPDRMVEVAVVNHTEHVVTATLEAGLASRQATLWPHVTQYFQVPREYLPAKVRFVLTDPGAPK